MNIEQIQQRLSERFPGQVTGGNLTALDPWIEVAVDALPDVCAFLRDDPALRFDMLHIITGVDYLQPDPKLAEKTPWKPHFELIYHLSSMVYRHKLVLKVMLPRWKDDVKGQLPEAPTVSRLWRAAEWHEREVYDLSGVRFLDHPDPRRILCPEDWNGHALRRDYEPPAEYHGITAS